jgi:tripartite ATP-independent transporter DctM subunit
MLMLFVLILFMFCALLGLPLFFTFGVCSTLACLLAHLPLQIIAQRLFYGMNVFVLLAIPGFVLVGEIMSRGGISKRLVDFSNALIGHFTGGLSMVAVLTGMIMGGISGSAVADTAAVASVLIPSMAQENYPKEFSSAVVGTAGPLGNIIPPSIPMIVYSMTAGVSVLNLFLAGYIPGMMIGFSLMALCYFISKRKRYGAGSEAKFSWQRVVVTFKRSILAILTPLLIVGGIVCGIFTPTESAMIGVIYCLIVAIYVYKEMAWADLPAILLTSAKITAKLVIIIAGASVFTYISIYEGIPEMFRNFMFAISSNKYVLLIVLNLILLMTGLVLDILVATVIIVPVLIPLGHAMGLAPLHMAMIFILNMSIGLLTPPVGYCLFVSSSIAEVPMERTAYNAIPIILTMVGVLALVNLIPELSLWVPSLVH